MGTMSLRKPNKSSSLIALATSLRCSVLRLFSLVCIHARRLSSIMKISQALAKTTGVSALIIWLICTEFNDEKLDLCSYNSDSHGNNPNPCMCRE